MAREATQSPHLKMWGGTIFPKPSRATAPDTGPLGSDPKNSHSAPRRSRVTYVPSATATRIRQKTGTSCGWRKT